MRGMRIESTAKTTADPAMSHSPSEAERHGTTVCWTRTGSNSRFSRVRSSLERRFSRFAPFAMARARAGDLERQRSFLACHHLSHLHQLRWNLLQKSSWRIVTDHQRQATGAKRKGIALERADHR